MYKKCKYNIYGKFICKKNNIEYFKEKNKENFKKNTIKTLIRQCSRWALASKQDESPMISLLHANYAAGYLWALRDIATDCDIEKYGKIKILEFMKKITNIQDKATKKMSKNNPNFIGNLDKELLKIGGDL